MIDIGAVWKKTTRDGSTYYSMSITLPDERQVWIKAFKNKKADREGVVHDNWPDWRFKVDDDNGVWKSEEQRQREIDPAPHNASLDEDVPF